MAGPATAATEADALDQATPAQSAPAHTALEAPDQAAPSQSPTQTAPAPALGRCRIGTAGWATAHWAGPFYPPGASRQGGDALLDHYQEHFDAVEANSVHYGTLTAEVVRAWRARAGPGFEFCWKAHKGITHDGRLATPEALATLSLMLGSAALLGEHLGVLLVQCPRTLQADVQALRAFAAAVDAAPWAPRRVAFEFRHTSWHEDAEVRALLRRRDWALVLHPNSVGRATAGNQSGGRFGESARYALEPLRAELATTASWAYVRLHGDNDEHTYRYTEAELQGYAAALHALRARGLDVYAFILNDDARAAMPHNARRLRQLVHELGGEAAPRPPKAAAKSIASFFGGGAAAKKRPRPSSVD